MHSQITLLVALLIGSLGVVVLCAFWLTRPRKPAPQLRRPAAAQAKRSAGAPVHHAAPTPARQPAELAPQQFLAQQLSAPPDHPPKGPRSASYTAVTTLLTPAEQSFLAVLREAAPDHMMICPQVRLANLVHTTARNQKQKQYDFYRIQAKCVDFVLCDTATTAPRLVIELDDRSHDRPDRQARDAFVDSTLGEVGMPILHVRWQRSYDTQQIREAIRVKLNMRAQPVAVASVAAAAAPVAGGWLTPIAAEVREVGAPALVRCRACLRDMQQGVAFCPACGAKAS